MQVLIKNAVDGWYRYTSQGKYAVLFLGSLVVLWALQVAVNTAGGGKEVNSFRESGTLKRRTHLLIFASVMAGLAIFPLTAAVFMKYQTSFFDYEWIWSSVPVTLIIAWGITEIYLKCYRERWRGKKGTAAAFAGILLAIVFLCGNMGQGVKNRLLTESGEQKAAVIMDKLGENGNTQNISLWAPADILQYAREIDGNIKLLYGRNMWEKALNAYSFDTYDEQVCKLYEWMEQLAVSDMTASSAGQSLVSGDSDSDDMAAEQSGSEPGSQSAQADAAKICMETAFFYGVNCIIVPEQCTPFLTGIVTETAASGNRSVEHQIVEGYHIYRIPE